MRSSATYMHPAVQHATSAALDTPYVNQVLCHLPSANFPFPASSCPDRTL